MVVCYRCKDEKVVWTQLCLLRCDLVTAHKLHSFLHHHAVFPVFALGRFYGPLLQDWVHWIPLFDCLNRWLAMKLCRGPCWLESERSLWKRTFAFRALIGSVLAASYNKLTSVVRTLKANVRFESERSISEHWLDQCLLKVITLTSFNSPRYK